MENDAKIEGTIINASLRDMLLFQMQEQAAISKEMRENDAIIFEALAAIYEKKTGDESNG